MQSSWDVIVVGAGITGLAAAFELRERGREVLVIDRRGVAAEQSAGLGRIFRIAHGDARLCSLAMEAGERWRRWEADLGAGRLLGEEGLVSAGPLAATQMAAMLAARAPVRSLDRAEVARLVPHLSSDVSWTEAIHDPTAGSLRIRRAHDALAARLTIIVAEVVEARNADGGAHVRLADGTVLHAAHVLLCAGTATGPLAARAGIDIDLLWLHHVRLTYTGPGRTAIEPSAALILEAAYGLPLGSTGRWALGLHDPGPPAPTATVDPDEYADAVRRQHAEWVRAVMPALDPTPVDEVRCVSLDAPFLDPRGDGFVAVRRDRIIACTGSNMMKFGPLLGDRLARTVLDSPDEGVDVHPDLTVAPNHSTAP